MTILGHLVIAVVILWTRDEVVKVCVDWDLSESVGKQIESKNTEMTVALSLTVALVAIELLCFMTGISMFYPLHSFLSFLSHAIACVGLGLLVMDGWECALVWWLFAIFTLIPAVSEILLISSVLLFKKPF